MTDHLHPAASARPADDALATPLALVRGHVGAWEVPEGCRIDVDPAVIGKARQPVVRVRFRRPFTGSEALLTPAVLADEVARPAVLRRLRATYERWAASPWTGPDACWLENDRHARPGPGCERDRRTPDPP